MIESYIYKKEVDWSLLNEGLTIPVRNQIVFAKDIGGFLKRGEKKDINLVLMGYTYKACIVNVDFNQNKYKRKDVYQIRYSKGSEIAVALKNIFYKSYSYLVNERTLREVSDRRIIKLPDEDKEYLVLYTTEYEDTYLLETITQQDIEEWNRIIPAYQEHILEESINYEVEDKTADIIFDQKLVKVRKLNKAIGNNLKLLYNYRCQICGEDMGVGYGTHIAEAHHIDYFIKSINNDANNQLVVCPNHHRIIHGLNPVFDRNRRVYVYENGKCEGLKLNYHL